MMTLGDEKTPLLLNGRRHHHQQQQQQQQTHEQQPEHHVISVPAMVVKDPPSTEYEAIIFGTTNCYSYGLSLDELLVYVDDPKWQLLRRSIFGLFWLILLLTFSAAVSLAYYHNAEGDYCSLLVATTNKAAVTQVVMATATSPVSPLTAV